MAWVSVAPASQSWTTQATTDQTWSAVSNTPSALRLARVFPQDAPQEDIPFIYQIRSEGAFLIASGSGIQVRSSITEPI